MRTSATPSQLQSTLRRESANACQEKPEVRQRYTTNAKRAAMAADDPENKPQSAQAILQRARPLSALSERADALSAVRPPGQDGIECSSNF